MTKLEIPRRLTIEWLRSAYASGRLAPEDVVRELIRRAEEDAHMNVWITPPRLERIRPYLNRLRSRPIDELPLWGVPFAIKDNMDCAGVPTTAGCPDYEYMPTESAAVVERLVEAGAIPLGKTNLDQFATGLVGTRSPYGETHNAWKTELISGGSSAGSAVAVARGHAVFALGTDTAGSGRVPAALNGIVGWKPSLGAWPNRGIVPASASLDCVTVFTHVPEDALAVDRAVRGRDGGDPWSRDIPAVRPAKPAVILIPKGDLTFFGPYAERYKDAWSASVERLTALGAACETVDIGMFLEAAALLYGGPYVEERWASLGDFIESHPGSALAVTERVLRSGQEANYSGTDLFRALHRLQRFKLDTAKLLAGAVLAMPTAGGTWRREDVRAEPFTTNSMMGLYTNHCNLLDLCAAAVPSDPADEAVPFGITFFALSGGEGLAYASACAYLNGGFWPSEAASPAAGTLVAVCGLHMRGYPLEKQMLAHGARFVREEKTAPVYELLKLSTSPPRPGLIRKGQGGASIHVELWEMPSESFGSFVQGIESPLGIGKVKLIDGMEVPGFLCEPYAESFGENITRLGSWHAAQAR